MAKNTDKNVDDIAGHLTRMAETIPIANHESEAILPVTPDEVWAAGVTYEISEKAQQEESTLPEVYRRVYDSERPELFFKATAGRTVGPTESIGIRNDRGGTFPNPNWPWCSL